MIVIDLKVEASSDFFARCMHRKLRKVRSISDFMILIRFHNWLMLIVKKKKLGIFNTLEFIVRSLEQPTKSPKNRLLCVYAFICV